MKIYLAVFWAAALGFGLTGCSSASAVGGYSPEDGEISALGAVGRFEATLMGPLFQGDGGVDIRLAVLAPSVQGEAPDYLPVYVQGLLNYNFKKYSGITLIDRQNLEKIISEQNLAAEGRFSDEHYVEIGQLTNAGYYLMGTIQKLSGPQYSVQLTITDANTGVPRATFMKTGTLQEIAGTGALINEATGDLLAQLGVSLTDLGRQSLLAGNAAAVRSETGLAKGITAQASGAEVEALFNYTQSIAFDPSQIEALSRLTMLSASISGGTISQRILNDIQARDRWLAAFKEAARFFNDHPPFEITFDPNLLQDGAIDYEKRQATLGMRVALDPSEAGFTALNALLEGLEKTGKRRDWGFSGWPLYNVQPKTPGTVVFGGKRSFDFKIEAALLNEQRKTLGVSSITLSTGKFRFSPGDAELGPPGGAEGVMRFPRVKAEDLTPTLTIVIRGVNGIPARTLNSTGYMKIAPGDWEKRGLKRFVYVEGGTFTMGSPPSEEGRADAEGPQHSVTVSSFYMGRYEVTQREYQEVMGRNPSYFKGEDLPVEQVSWYDAIEYCNKRSEREGLTPAYRVSGEQVTWNRSANGYRLPTEGEWEYACRAGTTTPYYTGSSVDNAGWYTRNSGSTTHPVGQKQANPWGLYDMHGNVWEWCWDWYGSYTSGSQTNPEGAFTGAFRVGRGGCWYYGGQGLRSAYRGIYYPSRRDDYVGFRLVRPSSPQ